MPAPYRTDRDALEDRLSALEKELSVLDARAREASTVAARREQIAREVADVRQRLLRERRTESISRLDGVRVATPCHKSWDGMQGDDRKRFCGDCKKHVYDLSSMTRAEAESFVREHEGPGACIRMHRRADGTLITADCPVGKRRVLRLRVVGAVAGVGLVGASVAAWAMQTTDNRIIDVDPIEGVAEVAGKMIIEEPRVTMGDIAPVDVPTSKPVEPTASPTTGTTVSAPPRAR